MHDHIQRSTGNRWKLRSMTVGSNVITRSTNINEVTNANYDNIFYIVETPPLIKTD